jgi:hypothetical protein
MSRLGSGGGFSLGGATKHHYALTLSVSVLNALNNVNLVPLVAVLGSPLFGQSIALASGPFALQVETWFRACPPSGGTGLAK